MKFLLLLSALALASHAYPTDMNGDPDPARMTKEELMQFLNIDPAQEAATAARFANYSPDSDVNPEELSGYFEGDIVIRKGTASIGKNGIINENRHWPNGVIPYVLPDGQFPEEYKVQVERAIADYANLTNGCVQWIPRTNENDYVYFTSALGGCFSSVGRVGGAQEVNLEIDRDGTSPCIDGRYGTIQHEMLHAMGFYHMQSTYNRDDYVTIVWANIEQGYYGNFFKYEEDEVSLYGTEYDYGSVMHYSRTAFSTNGEDTIVPTDPDAEIGQLEFLSDSDIEKLKSMYNCNGRSEQQQREAEREEIEVIHISRRS